MLMRFTRAGLVLFGFLLAVLIPVSQASPEFAPAWHLQTPDGKTVQFPEDARHQPSVLLFWPSWCPYSRALQPYVQDIWNDYRSEEHTSELQSLMRISYAVFCLKKKHHEKIHS